MNIHENIKLKPGNRSILAPIVLLVLSLVLLAANTVVVRQQDSSYQTILRSASNLESLSQKLASSSFQAVSGTSRNFDLVRKHRDDIDSKVTYLTNNDTFPIFSSKSPAVDELAIVWEQIRANTETVLGNEKTITSYGESTAQLQALFEQLRSMSIDIAEKLIDVGGSPRQIMVAHQQTLLTERTLNVISELTGNHQRSTDGIEASIKQLSLNHQAMQAGDITRGIRAIKSSSIVKILAKISDLQNEIEQVIPSLKQSTPLMNSVTSANNNISSGSELLLAHSSSIVKYIDEHKEESLILPGIGYLLAFLSLASIIWIALVVYRETNHQLVHTEEENLHNQNAILTLLDELGNLADGDLTTYVTVTEDFTGAIADSINYTIDQLRILVSSINETSVRVSASAESTQDTAAVLAKASLQQAKEIADASSAVHEMVSSIEQVSRNASESSTTAEQFLNIANTGADVVDNTLRGMDTIREQIQDTSKRIKRLSESSQEIGDIVSLIDDIADQTNILALNAAIQASMAGDAGRGFAVVADEVQRLAERSSAATKQIEALVKTIQSDTNEAGISMEKTTTEVVHGARLAKDAASALGDIEKVSNSLATLIDNISGESQQQLGSAENIAQTMNVIQEITTQTLDGSQATSKSIGNLTSISAELRKTVAGFRLPANTQNSSPKNQSSESKEIQ
jgi:twitching motility protein PilJ